MQSLIYCTDIHYGATPVSRSDDYNEAILKKLEFCLKQAKKYRAVLLIGGDLFDRPTQKFSDVIKLIRLFNKYENIQVIVNRGNPTHDGLYESSPLTILEQAGIIITSDNCNYVDLNGVRIIMAPNQVDPMSRDEFIASDRENYLMTHHLIVEKPTPYKHILMDDFVTKCSIVLCADYHPYQGIQTHNGTIFVAPGSIARRKNTKDNLEKIPRCVHIHDKGIDEIEIPYKKDVWVLKQDKEELTETELDMEMFNTEIDKMKSKLSLREEWFNYAKVNKISQEVFSYIDKRLFEES